MAKLLLYRQEAREALARGVAKLTHAVDGTIGPKGGNGIIDRPLGVPMITRDGVQIANEIELEDPFENMGAQVVREVSRQTNRVAGDGTTTATVLANAIIQAGLTEIGAGCNSVDLIGGVELATEAAVSDMKQRATELPPGGAQSVATIAANDAKIGRLVAEALEQVGPSGIIDIDTGPGVESTLEVVNGFAFDRGYVSHHLATEPDSLEAILNDARVLLTDSKISGRQAVRALLDAIGDDVPLLIIAEALDSEAVAELVRHRRDAGTPIVAVHPPEFGRWRESMMEDIAVLTGGRFLCAQTGRTLEDLLPQDLGHAARVRATEEQTVISGGRGDKDIIRGRQEQILRQLEIMEQPIERDKLNERLAQLKAGGGKAVIHAGGYTKVERHRRELLIEDAVNAARHAVKEGVVAGGGMALIQAVGAVRQVEQELSGDQARGASIVAGALLQPLRCIAENCGADPEAVVSQASEQTSNYGFDARKGAFRDLLADGIIDAVKVPCTALQNAASVSAMLLTTQVLITDRPEFEDPTAGPARGGGGEKLALD